MEWKYKIWLILAGAVLTVYLALSWNVYLAIALIVAYGVLIPLTVKKQFFGK